MKTVSGCCIDPLRSPRFSEPVRTWLSEKMRQVVYILPFDPHMRAICWQSCGRLNVKLKGGSVHYDTDAPLSLPLIWHLCSVLPAYEETSAQFGRMSSQIFSRSESKEIKHVWDNRRGSDCSLVAWVFRISCNHWFHSHCPSRGPDITCAAFRDRQNSKRVER